MGGRKLLKRYWNDCSKAKKYVIILLIWLINFIFYMNMPDEWYLLEIFYLIIAGGCGSIGYMIYKGEI